MSITSTGKTSILIVVAAAIWWCVSLRIFLHHGQTDFIISVSTFMASVAGLLAWRARLQPGIMIRMIAGGLLALTPSSASAQEASPMHLGLHIGYVPGDAFFSVEIKQSVAETFSESALSGATELRYRYAPLRPGDMTLPLYLGFEGIVLKNVDAQGVQIIQHFSDVVDRD